MSELPTEPPHRTTEPSAAGRSPGDVPVFNCMVHVAPPDAAGTVVARVANLAGIEGRGRTEREALAQAVALFKAHVASEYTAGRPIAWLAEPQKPRPGEVQRLIAVHL